MKDWSNELPPYETQYATSSNEDMENCMEESLVHCIEMLQGNEMQYSPRALAKLAGVTQQGSSRDQALDAVNTYGLIPYYLWPTPAQFDWNSYYAPIPESVLQQAIKVRVATIPPNLKKSPLWTLLAFTGTNHAVAQINTTQYFDSELGSPVKTITEPILSQYSIQLTYPNMIIQSVKFADGQTLGVMIDTPNGTQIIKATDEAQWRSWSLPTSYSLPTVNPDGTTNWNAQIQLPF